MLKKSVPAAVDFQLWKDGAALPESTDVVVNATSIGLAPHGEARVPIAEGSIKPHMVVADVIPNPPMTVFLREAHAKGCRILDGLGMLINQGAANFEYWTGVKPEKAVMRAALEEVFGGYNRADA